MRAPLLPARWRLLYPVRRRRRAPSSHLIPPCAAMNAQYPRFPSLSLPFSASSSAIFLPFAPAAQGISFARRGEDRERASVMTYRLMLLASALTRKIDAPKMRKKKAVQICTTFFLYPEILRSRNGAEFNSRKSSVFVHCVSQVIYNAIREECKHRKHTIICRSLCGKITGRRHTKRTR